MQKNEYRCSSIVIFVDFEQALIDIMCSAEKEYYHLFYFQ